MLNEMINFRAQMTESGSMEPTEIQSTEEHSQPLSLSEIFTAVALTGMIVSALGSLTVLTSI